MILFTKRSKLTLALSLALFGGAGSLSALALATEPTHEVHTLHEVMVEINDDENANITVEINGEITDLVVPKSALYNKEKLAEVLSDVPVEVREQLLADLGNIHISNKMAKVHKIDGESDMTWASKYGQRVIVVDSEDTGHDVDINQVVRRVKHHIGVDNTFVIKHDGKMGVDMVSRLIKDADYSQEELDKIQQAIDEQR